MLAKERKVFIIKCPECGALVKGFNSLAHAKANLKLHKKSKHHKNQIKLNLEVQKKK